MLDFFVNSKSFKCMKTEAYLGIDVSKGYADFLVMDKDKNELEPAFRLEDTAAGHAKLTGLLKQWLCDYGTIFCGVESTGGYEANWWRLLQQLSATMSVEVARLNPAVVKAISQASNKRSITDAVSAENIAVYLMSFPEKVRYYRKREADADRYESVRHYAAFLRMEVKQEVQLSNQLEKLLYQYLSPLMTYTRSGIPDWLLRLIVRYPGVRKIQRLSTDQLRRIKGIGEKKAKSLINRFSGAQHSGTPITEMAIVATAKDLLTRRKNIARHEDVLASIMKDDPSVKLLTTIPGVGVASAAQMVIAIADIQQFDSAKKLSAFFGVHPTIKQSGDRQYKSRMSKKGRPEVRSALYMCGWSGRRCNPIIKPLYARFRAKGMNHYQAMGVVMNKLIRIAYGILRSGKPFNPEVDQKNLRMAKERQAAKAQVASSLRKDGQRSLHRYQHESTEAPRSRKSAQTIKKQLASQSPLTGEHAGSPVALNQTQT
jgi:transposase